MNIVNKKIAMYAITSFLAFVMFLLSFLSFVWMLYFLFFLLIFSLVFFKQHNLYRENFRINKIILVVPLIIFIVARIMPFAMHGEHPLGYDTGFYNYNIEKDRAELARGDFWGVEGDTSLGKTESMGVKAINKSLISLGFSNEAILYWFYILIGLLGLVVLFAMIKDVFGEEAAYFSAFLYAVSFTQYLAYWSMLWKNALGVLIVLLIIYISRKENTKDYLLTFFLFAFLIITHKTSAILLLISYSLYLAVFKRPKKSYYFAFSVIVLFFGYIYKDLAVYFYDQFSSNFTKYYDTAKIREGSFIDIKDYVNYAIFYIPFSLLGVIYSIKNKKSNYLVLSLLFVSGIFVITKFVFYKRIIIFLDLTLIVYFGYGFSLFLSSINSYLKKNQVIILLIIISSFSVFLYFSSVINTKPLLSNIEVNAIISLRDEYAHLKVFTDDPKYNSWLFGFSGHEVISPGWGADNWDLEKWGKYWTADSSSKKSLLDEIGHPLLIYSNIKVEGLPEISPNFYLFKYKN